MNMVKRGLIALSVVAAIGGTTGGPLVSAAAAQPTRGPVVIRATQYEVGAGEAVGPFTSHGAVNTKGNVTDVPSLATDPPTPTAARWSIRPDRSPSSPPGATTSGTT